jgi:uncharacterized protein YkwD
MRIATKTLLAFVALTPMLAFGEELRLVQAINTVRSQGCGHERAVNIPMRHEPRLDRVAEAQSSGHDLKDAMRDAGYRAVQVSVLEASGSDAAILGNLAQGGCKDVTNPVYRDVGIAERDGQAWIVLAAPLVPPATSDASSVSRRVLELVNEARSKSRRCGWKRFEAAPALALSDALEQAALVQARDMAGRSALSHAGGDGSTPAERATRAGYRWRFVGENIASGQATPEQVVAEWLDSPHHCANLMSVDFMEMGVAWAADTKSKGGIYWAQVFGSPSP